MRQEFYDKPAQPSVDHMPKIAGVAVKCNARMAIVGVPRCASVGWSCGEWHGAGVRSAQAYSDALVEDNFTSSW